VESLGVGGWIVRDAPDGVLYSLLHYTEEFIPDGTFWMKAIAHDPSPSSNKKALTSICVPRASMTTKRGDVPTQEGPVKIRSLFLSLT
jgi:hypothetical protein